MGPDVHRGWYVLWGLIYCIIPLMTFPGMTTVEHALPVPRLFEDVLKFFALSGTGSTPTHIVNYGGVWGEQYVWAHEDVPNDPKCAFQLES